MRIDRIGRTGGPAAANERMPGGRRSGEFARAIFILATAAFWLAALLLAGCGAWR